MRQPALFFALTLFAATASLPAQTTMSAVENPAPSAPASNGNAVTLVSPVAKAARLSPAPFSRLAFGGGVSSMGVNLQTAVLANRYMNLRGAGNLFNYSINNVPVSGFKANGKVNLAAAGASLDFYPFPNHGFRLSPGALLYNQNRVSALGLAAAGTSITIDGMTYYSETSDPLNASASLGLNPRKQAFTMTTGWGNMISRRGGHWSFPFEIGAAFVGAPTLTVVASGSACLDQAQTECSSITGSSQIATSFQSNLTAQVAKWKNDLSPFRYYPIASFGIGYNFGFHGEASPIARAR
ncbi:conserved exported hypothetical protein [Candidatus Sulfotelmatomonas gaucii]|uniref:Outer membrane protein beta-barrel domain-containing protein n=1 Tax=Candidatus Sulfuritelmatomonas gaucii TaxID=2043161 RepID=A0A2N9L5L2_9BACT|nr:conserved exported hypothetical protein [Candidatus Sulfotelmatomonas gaucii]